MVRFHFSAANANSQYIQIQAEIPVNKSTTIVELPAWRPGRYELGNFAKNVRNFKVFGANQKMLTFHKTGKDTWQLDTEGETSITVQYNYFANELNAGSTFLDANQLYVNPVNCCVFTEETFALPVELSLDIPENWQVASSLEAKDGTWMAASTEELLDSPFIASGSLQKQSYDSYGVKFHVWFNGLVKPDWARLLKDFKAFTDSQVGKFSEFPVKEYHFLNQILPTQIYHGVEHQKSTVVALGPSYEIFGDLYKELLGVSSHELYHTWNVKAIRPIELYPYDFKRENYSPLGYLCEGVTTYMGDLFLYKSGVFNLAQYLNEFNVQLQRHFDNFGRFNYSVAESSFDTWLDGYGPGAPSRKVSIYTEGCLLAFVTDLKILQATSNKYGLDEVMRRLYFEYALAGKGVSESDYQAVIENVSGSSFDSFFEDYIHGTQPFESIITESLDLLGLQLDHVPADEYCAARLGFKAIKGTRGHVVKAMYPGGPAELAGLMLEDEIIAVNGVDAELDLNKWLTFFDDEPKTVTLVRAGRMATFELPEVNRNFYMKYSVSVQENPNGPQQKIFKAWSE